MTPSPTFPGHATGLEVDLDTSPEQPRSLRWTRAAAAVIALVLAGAGIGIAAYAVLAPEPDPVPPQAQVSLLEGHLETGPVATLRITLHNTGRAEVVVSDLLVEGVQRTAFTRSLGTSVPPRATVAVSVRTEPDCRRSLDAKPLRISLTLGDGRRVQAMPTRALMSAGGLCRQMRAVLPRGWQNPLTGASVRVVGPDAEVHLPAVTPGSRVAGVWAGEHLLTARGPIQESGGAIQPFRLVLPDQCVGARDATGVPTGLRVLLIGQDGLRERYAPLGPSFARWLLQACRPA